MLNLRDGGVSERWRAKRGEEHFIAIPRDLVRVCEWGLLGGRCGGRGRIWLRGAWGSHCGWGEGGKGDEVVGGGGELRESGRGESRGLKYLYLYVLLLFASSPRSLSAVGLLLSGNPTPQRCTSPQPAAALLATRSPSPLPPLPPAQRR